mmetsp:Transcript_64450/g.185231  ORF Transcript_64450/g.185231 Transcript_64450/m.185231 type:complete len:254 (-) Transcript_64450:1988-2749(-)
MWCVGVLLLKALGPATARTLPRSSSKVRCRMAPSSRSRPRERLAPCSASPSSSVRASAPQSSAALAKPFPSRCPRARPSRCGSMVALEWRASAVRARRLGRFLRSVMLLRSSSCWPPEVREGQSILPQALLVWPQLLLMLPLLPPLTRPLPLRPLPRQAPGPALRGVLRRSGWPLQAEMVWEEPPHRPPRLRRPPHRRLPHRAHLGRRPGRCLSAFAQSPTPSSQTPCSQQMASRTSGRASRSGSGDAVRRAP